MSLALRAGKVWHVFNPTLSRTVSHKINVLVPVVSRHLGVKVSVGVAVD